MHLCHSVPEYATFSEEADILSVDDFKIGCYVMDRNALVFFFEYLHINTDILYIVNVTQGTTIFLARFREHKVKET